jgi:hypothetical protein
MESNNTDAKESAGNPASSDEKERMNNNVAMTVAALAVFMAITKVTDDNICQAMEREKANEVNAWALYQAKSVKQNLAEAARAQLTGLAHAVRIESRPELDAKVARYDAEIARYDAEKAEIRSRPKSGRIYNALNFRDDQFDLSDAVVRRAGDAGCHRVDRKAVAAHEFVVDHWLRALLGVAGLARLKIHFGWLVKLLS